MPLLQLPLSGAGQSAAAACRFRGKSIPAIRASGGGAHETEDDDEEEDGEEEEGGAGGAGGGAAAGGAADGARGRQATSCLTPPSRRLDTSHLGSSGLSHDWCVSDHQSIPFHFFDFY
ncbi:unnamed protein product [Phaeothamnion confervicola]